MLAKKAAEKAKQVKIKKIDHFSERGPNVKNINAENR